MNLRKEVAKQLRLIERGTHEIISKDELSKKIEFSLRKNKPLKVKAGFDPTSKDIHLGHVVLLKKLRTFQDLGHVVYFIIGDFTARIGDPSGRSELRPSLTEEEVLANASTYTQQAFKILDRKKTKVIFNSKWFKDLKIEDFFPILKSYTLARLLERDDFSLRMKENKPITILEFFYPLLQGYDSVKIGADVELGGTDQKFNLIVGRHLQEFFGQPSQVIITLPLLVGLDGKNKMSKSLGNFIGIEEPPSEIFGKTMSISDELMYHYFELLTDFDLDKLKKMHPKEAKELLAFSFVCWFYDEETAIGEKERFNEIFSKKKLDKQDFPIYPLKEEKNILDLLLEKNLVSSRNEARRLIKQKALEFEGEKVLDEKFIINKEGLLKIGKKKFLRIVKNS
ncbi:MAG TPA: tyrosine--tRNA ligase [Candidatus Omnitrophica bacterium]|nr:tyrosine--tRNA ligase [Candidatus Omnitrophota bacterium]